jgi:F-box/WD-40 domain protein MET30
MVPVPVGLPSTTTNGATNGSANGNGLKRSAPSTPLLDAKKVKLDISVSDSEGEGDELKGASGTGGLTREVRLTRPWKTVYCERLVVERNWRKGRCKTTTLKASTVSPTLAGS